MDLSIFATAEAWISLVTLIFLEIVLGVDNLVFIAITANRLPPEKQYLGRRIGLAGALCMRILLLCLASFLISITYTLFTVSLGPYVHGFSLRDIILLVGGAYLIYLGIRELRDVFSLREVKEQESEEKHNSRALTLPRAVLTIMGMDVVLSVDSVITAVGLASHLIIMIIAVILAVILMMVFIDWISNFVNNHPEMTILALCFIVTIGVLLILDSCGITSGIEIFDMNLEKFMVYFAMIFAVIITSFQIFYHSKVDKYHAELAELDSNNDRPSSET